MATAEIPMTARQVRPRSQLVSSLAVASIDGRWFASLSSGSCIAMFVALTNLFFGLCCAARLRFRVIPLSEIHMIGPEVQVAIPVFQVHFLDCQADAIFVGGWDVMHKIELSEFASLKYSGIRPCSNCREKACSLKTQIFKRAKNQTLDIQVADSATEYRLVSNKSHEKHPGIVEFLYVTRLIYTYNGLFVSSRVIFAETDVDTIH